MAVLSAAISRVIFYRYACNVDEENLQEVAGRGLTYSERLRARMAGTAWDWGVWDDTYAFVQNGNGKYIESNIQPDTFTAGDFDVIAIVGAGGHILGAWQYDRLSTQVVVATNCLLSDSVVEALIRHQKRAEAQGGFVSLPCGLWLVGCAPVLTSRGEGAALGCVVVARELTGRHVHELADIVHSSARYLRRDEESQQNHIAGGSNMMVQRIHLAAINGLPGVDMLLVVPRVAQAQSYINALFLPAWILIAGSGLVVFMLWLLEIGILEPLRSSIASIRAGMSSLLSTQDESLLRVTSRRSDEMGELASSILEVLQAMEDSRRRLRESETLYRSLIDFLPHEAVCLDGDRNILAANRHFRERTGGTLEQMTGKHISDVWPIVYARHLDRCLLTVTAESTLCLPQTRVVVNGQPRWYEASITNINLPQPEKHIYLILLSDITDRVDAERRAREKQAEEERMRRLASLGTLVAGVAHEVNNPNAVISLNMNVLHKRLLRITEGRQEERNELLSLVSEAQEASQRISVLISSLKNISRPPNVVSTASVGDINTVLRKSVHWARHDIERIKVRIVWDLVENPPKVVGDEKSLTQVFVNLVQNACSAIKQGGGCLTIRSKYERFNGCLEVIVEDTGSGISPQVMPYIFDPFFTTNRNEGGLGLGLSISLAILEAMGAAIKVDSIVGRGTKVTVLLAVAEDMK